MQDLPGNVIGYRREYGDTHLNCYVNFGLGSEKITLPQAGLKALFATGTATVEGDRLTLGGLGAVALA